MQSLGGGFYTVSIKAQFSATHRLRLPDGRWEPVHGHDWKVQAFFTHPALDDCGMVIDFDKARSALQAVVAPLHHSDLNENPRLSRINPSAEVVARFLFDGLRAAGFTSVYRVNVTEAPGCIAAYQSSVSNDPDRP